MIWQQEQKSRITRVQICKYINLSVSQLPSLLGKTFTVDWSCYRAESSSVEWMFVGSGVLPTAPTKLNIPWYEAEQRIRSKLRRSARLVSDLRTPLCMSCSPLPTSGLSYSYCCWSKHGNSIRSVFRHWALLRPGIPCFRSAHRAAARTRALRCANAV